MTRPQRESVRVLMKRRWLYFLLGVMVFLIFLLLWFGKHKGDPGRGKPTEPLSRVTPSESATVKPGGIKLEGMEYSDISKGKTNWTISARVAEFLQDEKKSFLKDISAKFYLNDGDFISLKADDGIFYAGTKDMEIAGNVVIKFPNGYEAVTDKISYSNKDRVLKSDSVLKISGDGLSAQVRKWRYGLEEKKAYGDEGVNISWDFRMIPIIERDIRKLNSFKGKP